MTGAGTPLVTGGPSTGGAVAPARVSGTVLIGEMEGSGYRTPPALARRADGQTIQLTPLLYATLAALDGRRSYADIARVVSGATGKPVSEENARDLVDKLRPLGLAVNEDGSEPPLPRSNPLLGLRFKVAVTDEEKTRRLTAPFAALFNVGVVLPVMLTFVWICWWVLFDKGLASATHEAFARPGLLLGVLAVTVLSAGFHEFGHAAAARRGGATPGVMGAGLYLVWPAFYTDVTDSYRLGRAGRLRTDLGGLYFNAIVAVVTVGLWFLIRYDALLLLVATQILHMLRQLLPFVRFDGYHVLADLTGVPDLFQRIGPTLRSLVPGRPADPRARDLKPWARAVVTIWVLTVVPALLGVLVLVVLTLPRLVGTAWAGAQSQYGQLTAAMSEGDIVGVVTRALGVVIVVLSIAAIAYLLVRLVRQVGGAVWRATDNSPVRRGLAALIALTLMAGVAFAWWPDEERYRPIQPYEDGTLTGLLPVSYSPSEVQVGSRGAGTVMWPSDVALPTRERPQLAAVLVPNDETAAGQAVAPGAADADDAAEGLQESDVAQATPGTWIFPFDEPPAPDEGDTQALAVNTTDDTATYSVAFALVWAEGDEPVETTNEAYALASCKNCAAVAVAFQVVLVVGEADVAPQNIAVSVNYDCTSCLTYSLAVQLFVTLDKALGEDATARLERLWEEIAAYGATIGQVPLDEIQDRLTDYQEQILAIVEEDQGSLTEPSTTPTTSPSPSGTTTSSLSPSASSEATPSTSIQSPSGGSTPTTAQPYPSATSPSPTPSLTKSTAPPQSASPSPTAPNTSTSLTTPRSTSATPTPAG